MVSASILRVATVFYRRVGMPSLRHDIYVFEHYMGATGQNARRQQLLPVRHSLGLTLIHLISIPGPTLQ